MLSALPGTDGFCDITVAILGIPKVIESVMAKHENDFKADPTLEDILEADAWAREMVAEESARVSKGGVLIG